MDVQLPAGWRKVLSRELEKPYFQELMEFVDHERRKFTVYPPEREVFKAFQLTPYADVKVLLLGQDPYHGEGQAHGLCFSVRPGKRPPPSLVNILRESKNDLGCPIPNNGYLAPWARQGVMLLNAVLTVRARQPNSHEGQGWEKFTDAVIEALNARSRPLVFMLWGASAQKKTKRIHSPPHGIVTAAHPSPLSMKKFFGSKPFSRANSALAKLGEKAIDWCLPNV